jgi:hypothetical protein
MYIRCIFLILFVLLVGCTSTASSQIHDLIHPKFQFNHLVFPNNWEIVKVEEHLKRESTNLLQNDIKYSDIPYSVTIRFGKSAETNKIDLKAVQEVQSKSDPGIRTLYWVSEEKVFSNLQINESSQNLKVDISNAQEININGINVIYYKNKSHHTYNWTSNDKKLRYTLIFSNYYKTSEQIHIIKEMVSKSK